MSTLAERHPELLNTDNWPAPVPPGDVQVQVRGGDMLVAYRGPSAQPEGERFFLPLRFEVLVDRPPLPLCQLRIERIPEPRCVRLTLDGSVAKPLTASRIRVPLRKLVAEALRLAVQVSEGSDPEALLRGLTPKLPRAEPGKRLPEERLEEVARVYRYALGRELPPTNAVAKALDVSRSTAGRYVVRARRAGLLGPASPGVAGELDPEGGHDG